MKASNSTLAILLAAAAFAQDAPKPASLEGSVVNALTGEPLPRAHVMVHPAGQETTYGALAGLDGKFSLTGLPPGSYSARVERVGFITAPPAAVDLHPGDQRSDLAFKLVPYGSLSGRVTNADGQPVERLRLYAEYGSASLTTLTDDRGVYRFGSVRPGRYRVRTAPQHSPTPPEVRSDGTREMHDIATYYAGRVAVQAGMETGGIDIQMARGPIVGIFGAFSGLPGRAQPNIDIRKDGTVVPPPPPLLRADGKLVIWRLDPGSYTIYAWCFGPDHSMFRSAPVTVDLGNANVEHLDVHLIPPGEIEGRIEFDGDEAPAERITLDDPDGHFDIPSADIGRDRAFKLPAVPAGRYLVRISPRPAYVKSVRVGSAESAGMILDIRNGAPGVPVTLVLSKALATVTGSVSGGPGARVNIVPEDRASGLYNGSVSVSAAGAYTIDQLLPGRYKLFAWDPADGRNPEESEDQAEHIELAPGDKLSKDLSVRRWDH